MRKIGMVMSLFFILGCLTFGAEAEGLRIFISVDMEGISGVVASEDCSRSGKDYDYFRKAMTREANAAVEGALAAGAKDIWVRDSHGSARNILPEMLHKSAKLLRDWSGGPMVMMDGIDETFDAVIFIGYHAKAGTPDAILDHTMSGSVTEVSINGVSLPEAGMNALIAGRFGVPVVFIAGDKAVCRQAEELFGEVETVAVKKGIGEASLGLHPEMAREKIRAGVEKALSDIDRFKPYILDPPYTLVLKLKSESQVYKGSFYPGAKRTGDWELTFQSDAIMEVIKAFEWMH